MTSENTTPDYATRQQATHRIPAGQAAIDTHFRCSETRSRHADSCKIKGQIRGTATWLLRRLGLAAALAAWAGMAMAMLVVTAHHENGAPTVDVELAALGPARWEKPTVCVEDHVGPRWSSVLDNAAQQYNSHADLHVAYMFHKKGCNGWDQKIRVWVYFGGDNGVPGYTVTRWSGDYFTEVQNVHLNAYYAQRMTWKERLHVVNHELGHAFGLAHNDRTDSVMGGPEQAWLSRYDRDELHRRYPW